LIFVIKFSYVLPVLLLLYCESDEANRIIVSSRNLDSRPALSTRHDEEILGLSFQTFRRTATMSYADFAAVLQADGHGEPETVITV
jgi:hypothetical protein